MIGVCEIVSLISIFFIGEKMEFDCREYRVQSLFFFFFFFSIYIFFYFGFMVILLYSY